MITSLEAACSAVFKARPCPCGSWKITFAPSLWAISRVSSLELSTIKISVSPGEYRRISSIMRSMLFASFMVAMTTDSFIFLSLCWDVKSTAGMQPLGELGGMLNYLIHIQILEFCKPAIGFYADALQKIKDYSGIFFMIQVIYYISVLFFPDIGKSY